MARITVPQAQGWVEGTKFKLLALDVDLLDQIETEVLARIHVAYDPSTWVDASTTPPLVRVAITKKYVAWEYRKRYSEDISENDAAYAAFLEANADMIIEGIVDGSIEIPGLPTSEVSTPGFYPTDSSSAQCPTWDDPSLGPSRFSMGTVF